MSCKSVYKMFVKGSKIKIGPHRYECLLSDREWAAFVLLVKTGSCCGPRVGRSHDHTRIISNNPLDYFNNKEVKITSDPRK